MYGIIFKNWRAATTDSLIFTVPLMLLVVLYKLLIMHFDPSISTQAGAQSSAKAATAQVKGHYKDQQPAAPAFTWEGPYLGVYGGYAWGNSEFNSNAGVLTGTSYFTSTW